MEQQASEESKDPPTLEPSCRQPQPQQHPRPHSARSSPALSASGTPKMHGSKGPAPAFGKPSHPPNQGKLPPPGVSIHYEGLVQKKYNHNSYFHSSPSVHRFDSAGAPKSERAPS